MAHVLQLRPKTRHVNDGERTIMNSSNILVEKDGHRSKQKGGDKGHYNGGFLVQEVRSTFL